MDGLDRVRRSRGRFGALSWRWLLGGALLISLIVVVGPDKLWDTARSASPRWMLAVLVAAAIWLSIGGFNVWILLRRLARVRLATFLRIYVTSSGDRPALAGPARRRDADHPSPQAQHRHGPERSRLRRRQGHLPDLEFSAVAAAGATLYLPALGGKLWLFLVPLALVPFALLGLVTVRFMTRGRARLLRAH